MAEWSLQLKPWLTPSLVHSPILSRPDTQILKGLNKLKIENSYSCLKSEATKQIIPFPEAGKNFSEPVDTIQSDLYSMFVIDRKFLTQRYEIF